MKRLQYINSKIAPLWPELLDFVSGLLRWLISEMKCQNCKYKRDLYQGSEAARQYVSSYFNHVIYFE